MKYDNKIVKHQFEDENGYKNSIAERNLEDSID